MCVYYLPIDHLAVDSLKYPQVDLHALRPAIGQALQDVQQEVRPAMGVVCYKCQWEDLGRLVLDECFLLLSRHTLNKKHRMWDDFYYKCMLSSAMEW